MDKFVSGIIFGVLILCVSIPFIKIFYMCIGNIYIYYVKKMKIKILLTEYSSEINDNKYLLDIYKIINSFKLTRYLFYNKTNEDLIIEIKYKTYYYYKFTEYYIILYCPPNKYVWVKTSFGCFFLNVKISKPYITNKLKIKLSNFNIFKTINCNYSNMNNFIEKEGSLIIKDYQNNNYLKTRIYKTLYEKIKNNKIYKIEIHCLTIPGGYTFYILHNLTIEKLLFNINSKWIEIKPFEIHGEKMKFNSDTIFYCKKEYDEKDKRKIILKDWNYLISLEYHINEVNLFINNYISNLKNC